MKIVHFLGFASLAALAACTASTSPGTADPTQKSAPEISAKGPTENPPSENPPAKPAEAADASAPDATPPSTCTPLAAPNGSVNPASAYCVALGYTSEISDGTGSCAFPDRTSCEEWAFFRGECGQRWSFCELHGGTVSNVTTDAGSFTASYAECNFADGRTCHESDFAQTCQCP